MDDVSRAVSEGRAARRPWVGDGGDYDLSALCRSDHLRIVHVGSASAEFARRSGMSIEDCQSLKVGEMRRELARVLEEMADVLDAEAGFPSGPYPYEVGWSLVGAGGMSGHD